MVGSVVDRVNFRICFRHTPQSVLSHALVALDLEEVGTKSIGMWSHTNCIYPQDELTREKG